MASFEHQLEKKIYDNVHGFIYLTKEEKELLSTPYFQRLNHIKQLGLSYFVFPGAVHTRFSHSLGVLHITEKLIQRLKKIKTKGSPFKDDADNKKHKIARLAALLHDIGHYPLSHEIEASYKECAQHLEKLQESTPKPKFEEVIVKEEETVNDSTNSASKAVFDEFAKRIKSGNLNDFFCYEKDLALKKYHHEEMAAVVIKSPKFKNMLIKKFRLTTQDIDLICSIINGTNKDEDFFIISRLIKSNFDADQMDYMLRDTCNTGIPTSVDLDFIVANMDIGNYAKYQKTIGNKKVMGFRAKALPTIEQFLLAKYYWYTNILYYDKAYIVNFIARRIYSYLLLTDKNLEFNTLEKIKEKLENPEEFFFFNDNLFWDEINKIVLNKEKYPKTIVKLAEMLISRKFPELLDEKKFDKKIKNLNNKLISFAPSIQEHSQEMKIATQQFRDVLKDDLNLVPIPINKEIIKVSSTETTGEDTTRNPERESSQPEEVERRDRELYLQNEDLFVINDNKTCKKISDGSGFLQLFLEKESESPKKLFIFRIYNFENILHQKT